MWSGTVHVRRLLRGLGVAVSATEVSFASWERLPDKALLAIKWRMKRGRPFWHWVVFVRENGNARVLDSKKALQTNVRKDFGRIKPQWYIEVFD